MAKKLLLLMLYACGSQAPADYDGVDLPVGEVENALDKNWGHALECKPIPQVAALVHPHITISLEGNTLHLVDPSTGYDRVFAVGPGRIETDPTQPSYGESLSYYPILATSQNDFKLRASTNVACKTWWTDPDTGEKSPVFAGLPFMSFYGAYAIHGPIDNFTASNGGNLNRGFVSHGCVRMEAADVLEVYARVGRLAEVAVRVQREPERAGDGTRVDVPDRWIGAECVSDLDCTYAGGFCHANPVGGRGFCSKRCAGSCPDRARVPQTFCVTDPDDATLGMCTVKMTPKNADCRPQDHMRPQVTRRFQSSVTASVCMPGSRGWIGDRCLATSDCQPGNTCAAGTCTQACTQLCPDQPGAPWTTCLQGNTCGRICTRASNASECAGSESCEDRPRLAGGTKTVCTAQ